MPLALAFAIASGVPPEKGLITAVVAGFLISFLGGSRVQIGGPTGAFVVIVYGIVQKHGLDGLLVCTLIAGVLLIVMGLARFGGAIKFIPYPVVTGFTSGIALIIFSSEVKDLLGLKMGAVPAPFLAKWAAFARAIGTRLPAGRRALGRLARDPRALAEGLEEDPGSDRRDPPRQRRRRLAGTCPSRRSARGSARFPRASRRRGCPTSAARRSGSSSRRR